MPGSVVREKFVAPARLNSTPCGVVILAGPCDAPVNEANGILSPT